MKFVVSAASPRSTGRSRNWKARTMEHSDRIKLFDGLKRIEEQLKEIVKLLRDRNPPRGDE
jgi:hypothetical protein